MTASNAYSLRPSGRLASLRVCTLGLAIGLLAAASAANAAPPTATAAPASQAVPVANMPGKVEVSNIDFKRGDGGSGRLIVRFSGNGAMPDLRNQGSSVIVDVGNASLPSALQRPLNVVDFATPVQRVDARSDGAGTQLVLSTNGAFDSMAYQTGNEYIVEITPKSTQTAQTAVGGTSSGSIAAASAQVAAQARPYNGRPVTFNFQDVPVRTVLQLIAEESNLNIVASDTVQGNVTLRLINVPWDQALDIVLRAKGLDKRRDGGVVWVAPQPELAKFEQDKEDARIALDNREDLITDYIQINYHNAAAIFKALTEAKGIGSTGGGAGGAEQQNGFLSPRGRIVADDRTNTLMISDIAKKVTQMRELIDVIDRPVDQVLIEARIVIATDTFARDLGARFGIAGRRDGDRTQVINGNIAGVVNQVNGDERILPDHMNVNLPAAGFITNPAASIAYTLLGNNFNLDLELSALQEEGRGEVISNPRLVTTNQREAVIKQGREVGYLTVTGSGTGIATPTVQFKEALLELKVTPTITDDNRVFLALNVKKDEISRFISLGAFGSVPELARREISTAVLVDDGQTVVIGGVYEFSDRESLAKVPFLGDLPFLGNLFKKKGRSKDKAELLIFVTPKVLRVAKRDSIDR